MSYYQKPQWRPCYIEASDPRIVQSHLNAMRPAPESIGRNGVKIQRAGKKRVTYQEKIDSLKKAIEADSCDYQWRVDEKDESQKRKREDDDEEMQRKRIREEERGTNAVPFISTTSPCSLMNREAEDGLLFHNFSSLYPEVSSVEGPGDQPSTAGLSTSPTSVPLITLSNDEVDELRKYGTDVQPTKFQDSEPDDCIDASLLDAQLRELLYQASLVLC